MVEMAYILDRTYSGRRPCIRQRRIKRAVAACALLAATPASELLAASRSSDPGGATSIPSPALEGADDQQATAEATSPRRAATSSPATPGARQITAPLGMTDAPAAGAQGQTVPTPVAYSPPTDTDARTDPDQLLSLYQDGAGQSQTSMDELDLVLGRRQIFTDLRTLETRLNDMGRPTFNVVDRNSTQSDHLNINQLEVSQDFFFANGRDTLRAGLQRIAYDARGPNDVTQYAVGGTANVRLSDLAAVAGEFWENRLDYGNRTRARLATYDVFLTLRPSDVIRIDIDTSRRTFDNVRSLQLLLTAQSYGGSIDYTPTDRLRVTVRGFGASYSDRNRRRSDEVETVWRARSNPLVEIGLRGTNFHFTRMLDNGYFNPRDYYSGEAMFRVQSELAPRFTVELAGSGGAESADPGGVKPLVKGSLQAVYKLANGWSLDGEASHFTSRDSNSSGFSRTSFTLGLHYRF